MQLLLSFDGLFDKWKESSQRSPSELAFGKFELTWYPILKLIKTFPTIASKCMACSQSCSFFFRNVFILTIISLEYIYILSSTLFVFLIKG